jgi:hypothetical protein
VEGFDSDSKSSTSVGYETDGPGRDPRIGSPSDSEDEDEDNVAGGTDTGLDAGEVDVANASDRSSTDIDTHVMKKKHQELYCEFTWTDLANTIEPILPIPKPEGTGGRHYNIREMISLGSNHQDDEDTYRDIFVHHVHCCLHCYRLTSYTHSALFANTVGNTLTSLSRCTSKAETRQLL